MDGRFDNGTKIVCYAPSMIVTNGVWNHENPFDYSLSLFIFQLLIIVITTRIVIYILTPLRVPKVISEILGGALLGPSGVGCWKKFADIVFPARSIPTLETMANIGLLYFIFLVGVEMDLTVLKRTSQKALIIALAGIILPFVIGVSTAYLVDSLMLGMKSIISPIFLLFLGISFSITAFPVLARILTELKLLNTDLGRMAMSAAMINDVCAWILLAIAIILAESKTNITAGLEVAAAAAAFVLFCVFVIRPAITWSINRTPEGEGFNDFHICLILAGVVVCGFITDAIGIHTVFGAFIFGLVIPNGILGTALLEKLEDFVTALLIPLFFASSGLKTKLLDIQIGGCTGFLLLIIVLACISKVAGTLVFALLYDMTFSEGLSLGLLMNTKGLIEIIVLNIGRDHNVLDDQTFALMVIVAVITTSLTIPTIVAIYKPARTYISYKRRAIQRSKMDEELRILVCVHTPRNVPTMINLMEVSNATKRSPICIYALHLVELTGRASAMLIVHNTRKYGRPAINRTQAQSEHINNAFEKYEEQKGNVTIQTLTTISPYSTMHEDICNLAEDKRVTLLIVPFHKQQTVDGGMQAVNPAFRNVNQHVLDNAPCSVGILIDRGFGTSSNVSASHISSRVAVLFFGGADDREALAYARRMAEHPSVYLTVIRFLPGHDTVKATVQSTDDNILTVVTDTEKDKQLDEEYIIDFKQKQSSNEAFVYKEKVVNNGEETVTAIRALDSTHDLYIVGRGRGMISPLTAGLTDWSECPELGAIGDLLASSDYATTTSVLVVQQYIGDGTRDGIATPESRHSQSSDDEIRHIRTSFSINYDRR